MKEPNAEAPSPERDEQPTNTQPSEEWGERIETGRAIHRGGKDDGRVPGASSDPPQTSEPRSD